MNHWRNDQPITKENAQQTIMRREERDKKQKRGYSHQITALCWTCLSLSELNSVAGRLDWFSPQENFKLGTSCLLRTTSTNDIITLSQCKSLSVLLSLVVLQILPKHFTSATFPWQRAADCVRVNDSPLYRMSLLLPSWKTKLYFNKAIMCKFYPAYKDDFFSISPISVKGLTLHPLHWL